MKKWLLTVLIILGFLLGVAYLLFPRLLNVSNTERINIGVNSAGRFLMSEDKWPGWWPGTVEYDSISGRDFFVYGDYKYLVTGYKYNSVAVRTMAKGFSIDGIILLTALNGDSSQAEWRYSLETNSNPINKIDLYLESKKVNTNMMGILAKLKNFLEKPENVYGMRIDQVRVKDTILVATKISTAEYPSTSKIYGLIDGIKNYILINKAKETNFPMLHVWEDSGLFHTTVAIPVDVKIPGNDTYTIKRMVPGRILVSQVTGGPYRTKEALRQLGLFISDNNLASPAISFESLITNRMAETDTSKWVTKVYYPVM